MLPLIQQNRLEGFAIPFLLASIDGERGFGTEDTVICFNFRE